MLIFYMMHAQSAEISKQSVNGVKGVSPLSSLLDLVHGIPLDYMHCVLEGVLSTISEIIWQDIMPSENIV